MRPTRKKPDSERRAQTISKLLREQELREKSYRGQALKIFPPVCARCGREFEGKQLRELTVHHKDHNHDNNPPDGRNWELLCLYCHEYEHVNQETNGQGAGSKVDDEQLRPTTFKPFEDLGALLKPKDGESNPK